MLNTGCVQSGTATSTKSSNKLNFVLVRDQFALAQVGALQLTMTDIQPWPMAHCSNDDDPKQHNHDGNERLLWCYAAYKQEREKEGNGRQQQTLQ